MAKFPLFDPLGLPISPEAAWEFIESGARAVGGELKEIGKVAVETTSEAGGFDINGSFNDFQKGIGKEQDVAKTPELLKEEQKADSELNRVRVHFAKLTEDLARIQNSEPTPELDALTVEVATMGTEERNGLLGHQVGLDRKHTNNAYSLSSGRTALIQSRNAKVAAIQVPSPAKIEKFNKDLSMNLEELDGGSNVSAGAAAAGKVA